MHEKTLNGLAKAPVITQACLIYSTMSFASLHSNASNILI